MLSDMNIDTPLIFVVTLICAIIFCISRPQIQKDVNTMPHVSSTADDPSLVQQTNPTNISTFLVLDVEATCVPGIDFDWPNEIIVRNGPPRFRVVLTFGRKGMASNITQMGQDREE